MSRQIPYAVADFEQLAGGAYHFVDKTRFIRELERYVVPVLLRPRRFGKSLWCSLLECYYDVSRRERFDDLFGATEIGKEPTAGRNSYLVLRFDFSKVEADRGYNELRRAFAAECANALFVFYHRYAEYLGGEPSPRTAADPEPDAAAALSALLAVAKAHRAPPLYIVIDEYDNFTNQLLTHRRDEIYREVTSGDSFLRTFFKVVKAGVGEGTVGRVFITGVLPVTIDDLTSGFNIAQVITLEPHTLNMMGFTTAEVEGYVDRLCAERQWPSALRSRVLEDLRTFYNGYRFLPETTDSLYNATICNYYLNKLVIGEGEIPREMIDENLRIDLNWLRRLAGSDDAARALVERLILDGAVPVDMQMLVSSFSVQRFLQPEFFALGLFYLGLVTFADEYTLAFPNLSVKKIFAEYYNELSAISVSDGYAEIFRRFQRDRDWVALFAGYWERYVGQIPAQAFDKVNENFFRTTFFELCTRYVGRHFHLSIEVNSPAGRSDWQAVGREGSPFAGSACVIEFKHYSRTEGERRGVLSWTAPERADAAQAQRYAADLRRAHPELTVDCYVAYTVSAVGGRLVPVPGSA